MGGRRPERVAIQWVGALVLGLALLLAMAATSANCLAPATGSVVVVDDVTAVVPVMWARRCRGGTRDGADPAADCRTDTGATSASCDRANDRPGAGTNQATTERTVGRVIRIRERGRRQHNTGSGQTGDGELLFHLLNS
jgi:hypothetical protein